MAFIIGFTLRWLLKGWILAKLAIVVRRWLVKKYNLEKNFKQSKSEEEVRWTDIHWYANLAANVYKSVEKINAAYEKDFKIYTNEINEIRYIVLTDDSTKSHYVAIRGTSNSHNAMQDINFLKDKSKRLGINIHTGFHRTSEMIADDLLSRLDKAYKVCVTGHSLGGADAVIVSWYLDYANFNVEECVTFGQPKVTDSHGIRTMRDKIKLTRVVNETDVVPLVPPTGTHRHRYAHSGTLIKLLDQGKFCHLPEPDSLNFGVNSFWLFAARESFSFYEIGKEMPDHFMTHYINNMKACASSKDEVLWKERLQYINHEGMLGEFGKKKDK
jgi:triacylglycerol lipase|tara:strand:+ start:2198 stop:3181 length:984 start_codon:yes stop_codon:yes gene_type:complete